MASASYHDEAGTISAINVTPLVDVMLVLLVILMVTAPMIAAQGISVDSPEAATGEAVQGTLSLAITDTGLLVVTTEKGESRFAADNRMAALPMVREFHKKHVGSKAIIAGDKNISHGAVMEVIDMVRSAGIKKFALRTSVKRPTSEAGRNRDEKRESDKQSTKTR